MRVDQVVPLLRMGSGNAHHSRREGTQLAGQIFFVQALERPGRHMVDEHGLTQAFGVQRRDVGLAAVGGSGENLHQGAACGEESGRLHDVDIQTASVPRAGLLQRRGVHADHRHSVWPRTLQVTHPLSLARAGRTRSARPCAASWGARCLIRQHAPQERAHDRVDQRRLGGTSSSVARGQR